MKALKASPSGLKASKHPLVDHKYGHNGESLPSFCNGLGTIYTSPLKEGLANLTTRDMDSELRYSFRKVLGTQNCPTLRLASHHCVLCLNPIKGTLNIVSILTHTLAYI